MDDNGGRAAGALALHRPGQPLAAMIIALCAAAAALVLTRWLDAQFSVWVLAGLGMLAGLGLLALLGVVAGLVHIGSMPRQRAFFEGLADAIDEAFSVTDSRGRVVYANGRYRREGSCGWDLLAGEGD